MTAPPSPESGAGSRGRGVLVALLLTVLVLAAWPLALSPLIDLETSGPAAGAHLSLGFGFLVLAPVCDVLDALTLLGVAQNLALILGLIALYAVWRVLRGCRHGARAGRELRLSLRALGGLVAIYGIGILAPRPMAKLVLDDPDAVAVDVHSHTSFSHDGRPGFTPRANRAWHRAAGFDVAYITDHKSYDGAAEGMRSNPAHAGDGLVTLSGIEFIEHGVHVLALGATERTDVWLHVDPRRVPPSHLPPNFRESLLIQTIPDDLSRLPAPDGEGRHGVLGIELSDGAPRGIQQGQRDHGRIARIADSLNLAVVAGSNNHGWGRTAIAWSVLRIPGWRALTPDSLGIVIENRIRGERRHAVRIVARRSPDPGRSLALLADTLPAVAWNMLLTMSPLERGSWIAWAWIIALASTRLNRRRARAGTT